MTRQMQYAKKNFKPRHLLRGWVYRAHVLLLFLINSFSLQAVQTAAPSQPLTLTVAKAEWCPQMCDEGKQAGYVVDIVNEVFASSGFRVTYQTFPWSRAIAQVRRGRLDALLAPATNEAPGLIFPKEPVGYQRMCFYVPKASTWRYLGFPSLKGLKIGVTSEVSFGEIDEYIRHNQHQFHYISDASRHIEQQIRMLVSGRLDTFIESDTALNYYTRDFRQNLPIKQVGCATPEFIYMAFTPNESEASRVETLIGHLEAQLRIMRNDGRIKDIMENYSLPDWSYFKP